MSSDNTILACKSGHVTTDANGKAQVIFTSGFENPTIYAVYLTCLDSAVPVPITAYPSNLTNIGFTISSYTLNQPTGGAVTPCVLTVAVGTIVHWIAVIESNV